MNAAPIRKLTSGKFTLFAIVTIVTFTVMYNSPAQPYADYLMPINPVRPYEESVERLLGNRWGHGTMIYSDLSGVTGQSFAISAWGKDDGPKTLTYLKLDREGDSAKVRNELDVAIDDGFAGAIYDAWRAMLLKTRYPDKLVVSTGGWHAEFSASIQFAGGVYGECAPVKGFSKELMDFGFALKDYCLAGKENRKVKQDSLIPRLKDFTSRVEHSRLY